jgi:beta-N-acetylhexosaminidase
MLLMVDLESTQLTPADCELLEHPCVGGVVLFSRHYEDYEQLCALVTSIKALDSELVIAVDHEGGRVQRFRDGFSAIPAMGKLGQLFDDNTEQACAFAQDCAWVLASELAATGVDFSFTPVVDLDLGVSAVIGDRAFHREVAGVVRLARAFAVGLREAKMPVILKHFPGHGSVAPDSHVALPVDHRALDAITSLDLAPFAQLIASGDADGVMTSHVVYAAMDHMPASFSAFWIKTMLRERLGFKGLVFSDDLSMVAATAVGSLEQAIIAAWQAGCDVVLSCNQLPDLRSIIDQLPHPDMQAKASLGAWARQEQAIDRATLQQTARWQLFQKQCAKLDRLTINQ